MMSQLSDTVYRSRIGTSVKNCQTNRRGFRARLTEKPQGANFESMPAVSYRTGSETILWKSSHEQQI
jgi:hypothetical protein